MYGELKLCDSNQGKIPAIPIVIHNPPKMAALRLPTAEEISAYTASVRQLIRPIGRRQSEDQDVRSPEAERKIFDAMRLDPTGDEFDAAEVRHAVETVLKATIKDCEKDGDNYAVFITTLWGVTVHTCRTPTTRELQDYREGVIKSRTLAHGVEERRFPPEVPTRFYDSIIQSVDGYSPQFNVPEGTVNGNRHPLTGAELKNILPQIPPHHKRLVAGEVSSQIYELDPQLDPS